MSFCPLKIFFITLILLKPFFGHAEGISLKASLDKNSIALEENFVITVEVFGLNQAADSLILPLLENFLIIKGDKYQKFVKASDMYPAKITTVFRYLLEPLKSGDFTINPFTLKVGDKKTQSNKMHLLVAKAPLSYTNYKKEITYTVKDRERILQDFTLNAHISDGTVYLGQPFVVSFDFARPVKAGINNLKYSYPDFENFFKEHLPVKISPDVFVKDNKEYQKETISFTLCPITTGTFSLKPAEINFGIMLYDKNTENYEFKNIKLVSKELEIEVLPLPSRDKSRNMLGVSNDVTIDLSVNKTDLSVGNKTQITIKITGDGFWQTGKFSVCKDDNIFAESLISDKVKTAVGANNKVFSIRTIKKEIEAKKAGIFNLKDVSVVYFSPLVKKYITLKALPLEIKVQGKKAKNMVQKHSATLKAAHQIKDIKRELTSIKTQSMGFYKYIICIFLVLMVLVFTLVLLKKRKQRKAQSKAAKPIQRSGRNRHPRL